MIQLYIYSFSDSFPLYFITRFFKKLFMYLFLAVPGLYCCTDFPLVAANGGYSLVVVCGLLIVVTSIVAEHGLSDAQASVAAACELGSYGPPGSRAALGLSCSVACGIFLDQRSNPRLLHWQADSLPLSQQGSPTRY